MESLLLQVSSRGSLNQSSINPYFQKLDWKLLPPTIYAWSKYYISNRLKSQGISYGCMRASGFPKVEFMKMMQIADLILMDSRSLAFLPSEIAACLLYLFWIRNGNFQQL
jgi:hypothetical protein